MEDGREVAVVWMSARPGTAFLLASDVNRLQSVQPRPYQEFYGEPRAVLSGARIFKGWTRDLRLRFSSNQAVRPDSVVYYDYSADVSVRLITRFVELHCGTKSVGRRTDP